MSYYFLKISSAINQAGLKPVRILLLLCLILASQAQLGSCSEYTLDGQPLTPPEKWVLAQVMAGKRADLEKRFGIALKNYQLRARFLEKLIAGEFDHLRIPRQGVQIFNAIIENPLDLRNAEVNYYVRLSRCIFKKRVDLRDSHFKKSLDLSYSLFCDRADSEAMKVDGDAIYDDAIFEDEVVWTAVTVGGRFNCERVEFWHPEKEAIFNSLKVGDSVFIRGSIFHGPVNAAVAYMGRHLQADGTTFLSPNKTVNFRRIRVGMSAFFRGASFHGPVIFQSADIAENFVANGAIFLGPKTANLSRLKVGQKALFDDSDKTKNQEPLSIRCPLDMSYGNYNDLEIRGSANKNSSEKSINLPSLSFRGGVIQHELIIEHAKIAKLDASKFQVKGPAKFSDLEIETSADFGSSACQSLDFIKVTWPKIDKKTRTRQVDLAGLTYNAISIDKDNSDYQAKDVLAIKDFVETSPFNTESYVQLETFFRNIGREDTAKEVFIRMHDRELSLKIEWYDPRRWLEWLFWGKIAGYGRAPFRVFFLSMIFILLGAFLFDPEYLTANKMSPEGRIYKSMIMRFFLSLDRFLPIELGLAKYWEARERKFFIWFYFYLHQVLGWILLPIALASIYSQLK